MQKLPPQEVAMNPSVRRCRARQLRMLSRMLDTDSHDSPRYEKSTAVLTCEWIYISEFTFPFTVHVYIHMQIHISRKKAKHTCTTEACTLKKKRMQTHLQRHLQIHTHTLLGKIPASAKHEDWMSSLHFGELPFLMHFNIDMAVSWNFGTLKVHRSSNQTSAFVCERPIGIRRWSRCDVIVS